MKEKRDKLLLGGGFPSYGICSVGIRERSWGPVYTCEVDVGFRIAMGVKKNANKSNR